ARAPGCAAGRWLRGARRVSRRVWPRPHAAPQGARRLGRALEAVQDHRRLVSVAGAGTEARRHPAIASGAHPPAAREEAAPRGAPRGGRTLARQAARAGGGALTEGASTSRPACRRAPFTLRGTRAAQESWENRIAARL